MIFHGEVIVEHLHLDGVYNGVDTAERIADSISLYETNVTVTGMKTFKTNVTFQSLYVTSINHVPMRDYLQHVVRTNADIYLRRGVTVEGNVWAPFLRVDSLVVKASGCPNIMFSRVY